MIRRATWAAGAFVVALTALVLAAGAPAKPSGAAVAERNPSISGAIASSSELAADAPGETPAARLRCTTPTSFAANVLSDCAFVDVAPHNETSIAVNPLNRQNLVAGANGFEFYFQGATIVVRSLNDFRASFDGGHSWTTGYLEMGGFNFASDPVFAFDTNGNAFYANIAGHAGQASRGVSDGSVVVARSTDGGLSYALPVLVDKGSGNIGRSVFDDKEWLTTDTSPSSPRKDAVYVTWTQFVFGPGGAFERAPILFSGSTDGGATWSRPREISGSGAFCVTQVTGPANQCDEDQFSVPAVGPDGTIYVAFENSNTAAPGFRSQYLVVRSSDGGATWQGPFKAASLVDGVSDYPVNVSGRQTLTDVQYRVNSAGAIAVSPDGSLNVVFSDNRNGSQASTNTDVFLTRSVDGGATWTAPTNVSAGSGDQFYPWVAVAPSGTINVAYYDDSYDAAHVRLGMTLARSTDGGATWTRTAVHTALSDPNHQRWFSGATNGKTTFLGDYNGLALDATGRAHMNWTDLRLPVAPGLQIPPNRLGNQNIFYASVP